MISPELNQALRELRARVVVRLLEGRHEVPESTTAEALERGGLEQVYDSFNAAPPPSRGPLARLWSLFARR